MKNLNRLQKERPNTKKVDLSFCQLEEIDSLMAELYRFKNMEELNLSANRLEKLPEDMGILKSLKKLDVSNNLFTNVRSPDQNREVLKSLKTIEHLTQLFITCTPAEESAILKELPKLNVLNRNVLRKEALLSDPDGVQASDLIKSQIESQKLEKETKLKTLRKRLKLTNEDIEESQKLVGTVSKVASSLNKAEDFKSIGGSFQAVIDRTKETHRRLENQSITAFEQSYQVVGLRYELLEVFFKPLCQLADSLNEDFAAGLRLVLSLATKLHETSQSLLHAATEMAAETGGKKGAGGVDARDQNLMDTINTEKEVWMLRKGEMERELLALREENKRCYELIVKLAKDEAEGQKLVKTVDAK